ncbi:MAG: hypothetical protein QM808_11050 [Steroidobacteraceae bacterium]
MTRIVLPCSLIVLMALAPPLQAASQGGSAREAFFRCRDAKGQTYFGDSMPSECQNVDTEVLSERGSVIRVIDGASSRAEKAQRKSAEDAALKAQQDAQMRDRMLVEAYLSVQEIERLRDQRVGLVAAQIRVDEQNLVAQNERVQRLMTQLQRYRPYSSKPNAPLLPDHVAEEMVSVINSGTTTKQRIADKQTEQQELEAKFASDIKRFKELKGIK